MSNKTSKEPKSTLMERVKENPPLFQPNQTYFTICVYIFLLVLACGLGIRLVYHWDTTLGYVKNLLSNLSSFLFGILIAFMVNPLVCYLQNLIFHKIFHEQKKRLSQALSILLAYLVVFGFLIICLVYVIPQLISSISDLSTNLPSMYSTFTKWLISFAYRHQYLSNDLIQKVISTLTPKILEFSTHLASELIPLLYSASIAIIKWFVTFLISIIISIYLLADKRIIFENTKRILYAFLPKKIVHQTIDIAKNCYIIFSDYIIAKAIDSLIIGLLCFILMSILHLPYTILISVIVGITNMIPYFGPYIGSLPGIFILSALKFRYGIIFLILIIVLQQFDGLILGPRILGNSTGLRPILILFAITFGGAYFGVLGMFLGVPVIAVIQYLINLLIEKRLKDKDIKID